MKFYASNSRTATTLFAIIILYRDQYQSHALRHTPSYLHLLTGSPSASLSSSLTPPIPISIRHDGYRKIIVRSWLFNSDDFNTISRDEFDDDAASQAIINGQGDIFSFLGKMPRGGGEGVLNNSNNNANIQKLLASCMTSAMNPTNILQSIKEGYEHRIAADPYFLSKSIMEIALAAITQYMAEVRRRGKDRILTEFDFVFAGVLTAICGKYYSMWRVAKTVDIRAKSTKTTTESNVNESTATSKISMNNWREKVPTNAFQPTLFDGYTTPSLSSRILAFLLPMPQLFKAGVIASTIGYGLTSILIHARALLAPQYVVATEPVPVILAAVYTGLFMAIVSNIRYQILQGIVEPFLLSITEALSNRIGTWVNGCGKVAVLLVRYANGVLGSWIAIGGMRAVGLQKLKRG